jgi:hypothetical protein
MDTKKAPTRGQGWEIETGGNLSMPSLNEIVKGMAYATT